MLKCNYPTISLPTICLTFHEKSPSRLEHELGVQLLTRTTRRLSLTHEGEIFYDKCLQILQDLEEAELLITQSQSTPQGHLSIGLPVAFDHTVLPPVIAAFSQRYPLVSTSLFFSDRMVNLIDEGFDVVIRIGYLEDSRLIARQITTTKLITCASQHYLDSKGKPEGRLYSHDTLPKKRQTRQSNDLYFLSFRPENDLKSAKFNYAASRRTNPIFSPLSQRKPILR